MIFIPLKNFFSEEARSQYVAGLRYTITPTNHALRRWAAVWQKEGKIAFLDEEGRAGMARDAVENEARAQSAGMSGVATVSDPVPEPAKPSFWQRVKSWL